MLGSSSLSRGTMRWMAHGAEGAFRRLAAFYNQDDFLHHQAVQLQKLADT